jgi:preprotein translocase subunit YajC
LIQGGIVGNIVLIQYEQRLLIDIQRSGKKLTVAKQTVAAEGRNRHNIVGQSIRRWEFDKHFTPSSGI